MDGWKGGAWVSQDLSECLSCRKGSATYLMYARVEALPCSQLSWIHGSNKAGVVVCYFGFLVCAILLSCAHNTHVVEMFLSPLFARVRVLPIGYITRERAMVSLRLIIACCSQKSDAIAKPLRNTPS